MTIKPLVVAPTQKRGVTAADKEEARKEAHSHVHTHTHTHNLAHAHAVLHSGHNHGVGEQSSSHSPQNVVVRSAASHSHSHRNVVIDGHGQSPQRRVEVYDELARHRRSPHKSTRSKRRDHHDHHHNKRDRCEREKLASVVVPSGVSSKCSSPHVHGVAAGSVVGSAGGNSPAHVGGGKSPEQHLGGIPVVLGCQSPKSQNAVTQAAANLLKAVEDNYSGYNSGDEHLQPKEGAITADEWQQRDEQFAKSMSDRGYILKPVEEDGACLFRSISLQIYGDEEMHDVIRQHTMDYIYKNREYFCHFVTEDINSYIKRKRRKDSHGNHIELQAISEIYSRPVEVYCYKPTPINIFNSEQLNNGFAPLRLSYQRGSHYNAIIDPYNATVGVGLGLAGYKPELQTKEAARLNEQLEIEQTMFEDKLKTTDWEATNEAIEEQIARESYLQWCRENLQKSRAATAAATSTSATVTSAEAACASDAEASPSKYSMQRVSGSAASNSTITAAAVAAASHAADGGVSGAGGALVAGSAACIAAGSSTSAGGLPSSLTMLEHTFALSPKSLSALAHNLKKDTNNTTVGSTCDLGFDSDDTDMSSTSSMGNAGNASPSSTSSRAKKTKSRTSALRGSKKRRREQNAATLARSDSTSVDALVRKSPKRDLPLVSVATAVAAAAVKEARTGALTPEVEQLPSTSKQSHTPEKNTSSSDEKKSPSPSSSKQAASSFYQELLEASYTRDGFGQLNESDMLQRAIQMSTQDYIEDQKRKYLYMGHK